MNCEDPGIGGKQIVGKGNKGRHDKAAGRTGKSAKRLIIPGNASGKWKEPAKMTVIIPRNDLGSIERQP